MTRIIKGFLTFVSAALFMASAMTTAHAGKVRIALAETASDELAAFFVALDRAKAMGLDYEWTAFSDEELAIQAILSGQMDIGFGTPYSVMQRSKAPVRIIYQLSKLKFFPVTSKKYSKLITTKIRSLIQQMLLTIFRNFKWFLWTNIKLVTLI